MFPGSGRAIPDGRPGCLGTVDRNLAPPKSVEGVRPTAQHALITWHRSIGGVAKDLAFHDFRDTAHSRWGSNMGSCCQCDPKVLQRCPSFRNFGSGTRDSLTISRPGQPHPQGGATWETQDEEEFLRRTKPTADQRPKLGASPFGGP